MHVDLSEPSVLCDLWLITPGRDDQVCMNACMYACTRMYACMRACVYVCMHACMRVCMHVCMYVCKYVCMYLSIDRSAYVLIWVKYIHTPKHADDTQRRKCARMTSCERRPRCLLAASSTCCARV